MSRLGIYLLFKIQRKNNKGKDEEAASGMSGSPLTKFTSEQGSQISHKLTLKVCGIQQRRNGAPGHLGKEQNQGPSFFLENLLNFVSSY